MIAIHFYVWIVWYSFFLLALSIYGEKREAHSRASIKQPVWGKQLTFSFLVNLYSSLFETSFFVEASNF